RFSRDWSSDVCSSDLFMCSFPPHGAARLGRPAPARYPVACRSVRTRGPGSAGEGPDWDALREAARSVAKRAYVPYSRFPVGAAAIGRASRTERIGVTE